MLKLGIRGGGLMLIACFMIVSAVVRLAAEAGPAISRVAAASATQQPQGKTTPKDMPDAQPASVDAVLAALGAREKTVQRREDELEERLQALRVAEDAVEQRLQALQDAEERLRSTLAVADGATERDVAQLTTVYEQMKSKEAAAVFEQMAPEFAAGFLARMRPEIAASVLEGMDPRAAYTISVVLAGRNFRVPTQ